MCILCEIFGLKHVERVERVGDHVFDAAIQW